MSAGNHIVHIVVSLRSLCRGWFNRDANHRWHLRHLKNRSHRRTVFQLRNERDAILHLLFDSLQFGLRSLKPALRHQVGSVGLGESLTASRALPDEIDYLILKFYDGWRRFCDCLDRRGCGSNSLLRGWRSLVSIVNTTWHVLFLFKSVFLFVLKREEKTIKMVYCRWHPRPRQQ